MKFTTPYVYIFHQPCKRPQRKFHYVSTSIFHRGLQNVPNKNFICVNKIARYTYHFYKSIVSHRTRPIHNSSHHMSIRHNVVLEHRKILLIIDSYQHSEQCDTVRNVFLELCECIGLAVLHTPLHLLNIYLFFCQANRCANFINMC